MQRVGRREKKVVRGWRAWARPHGGSPPCSTEAHCKVTTHSPLTSSPYSLLSSVRPLSGELRYVGRVVHHRHPWEECRGQAYGCRISLGNRSSRCLALGRTMRICYLCLCFLERHSGLLFLVFMAAVTTWFIQDRLKETPYNSISLHVNMRNLKCNENEDEDESFLRGPTKG